MSKDVELWIPDLACSTQVLLMEKKIEIMSNLRRCYVIWVSGSAHCSTAWYSIK